jgi:hypothetical protein
MTALPEIWGLPLRMGWSVIPLRPRDKVPALASWRKHQTNHADPVDVEQWAVRGCNIGIVTGTISGLLVLDLDSTSAITEAGHRGLPQTVIASTAKGRHHYFRHPGGNVKNRAGILPGIDIRADGGFVVGPGSIHPSGIRYQWVASPNDTALALPPAWLMDLLTAPRPASPPHHPQEARTARSKPPAGDGSPYGRAALWRESDGIRRAFNGMQEVTLNCAALRIGALVAGGELSRSTARVELIRAGMCMPNFNAGDMWTLEAITAKVDRALTDGSSRPRYAPEPMVARHG